MVGYFMELGSTASAPKMISTLVGIQKKDYTSL